MRNMTEKIDVLNLSWQAFSLFVTPGPTSTVSVSRKHFLLLLPGSKHKEICISIVQYIDKKKWFVMHAIVQKAQISKLENNITNARFDTVIKVFNALHAKVNFQVELPK